MRKIVTTAIAVALLSATPAFADKKTDKSGGAEGRGGLSEWPVSKEEANWSGAAAGGASSSDTKADDKSKK